MDVRNCRKCGKVFNYISGVPICQACRELEEQKFQEVKQFVQDCKEAGINEIVEHCGVSHNQVNMWIRQERLVFADDSPIGINCEGCGTMIKTGRFCEKCKIDLARGINNAVKPKTIEQPQIKKNTKENPRMRYLD
ncbi:MAG: flagellar protein [Lachnospiraceae bacterium]|nr:flagellar protein [Lachnospiraceae bacterium]